MAPATCLRVRPRNATRLSVRQPESGSCSRVFGWPEEDSAYLGVEETTFRELEEAIPILSVCVPLANPLEVLALHRMGFSRRVDSRGDLVFSVLAGAAPLYAVCCTNR